MTTGAGANPLFAYGTGTPVTANGTTLSASGQYAHGAMASGGGRLTLFDGDITTTCASSAAVATGGGTVTVHGGTMTTSDESSPRIYSTGAIYVTGATMTAQGAEAAVVEGDNSVTVSGRHLTRCQRRGVMLDQSVSGDAGEGTQSSPSPEPRK